MGSGAAAAAQQTVRSIDYADKHPAKISSWIKSIQDVHRQKPAPTVSYSRIMPDLDELLQVCQHR
jgi:intraflagellar transport protein 46